jgi:hypothetical protein
MLDAQMPGGLVITLVSSFPRLAELIQDDRLHPACADDTFNGSARGDRAPTLRTERLNALMPAFERPRSARQTHPVRPGATWNDSPYQPATHRTPRAPHGGTPTWLTLS